MTSRPFDINWLCVNAVLIVGLVVAGLSLSNVIVYSLSGRPLAGAVMLIPFFVAFYFLRHAWEVLGYNDITLAEVE